jgi:uncharacterized damage-inducible protein DinB
MIKLGTIHEGCRFTDWARDKLLGAAKGLSDAQLDRPFEVGEGSLRATLRHLYGAERVWLERWRGTDQPRFPNAHAVTGLEELQRAWCSVAEARNEDLAALASGDLDRPITYRDRQGLPHTAALGDILLQVCNHGVHHRAQALNMLRHLGAPLPKPGLDYIFMRLEQPDAPPPQLDLDTLRAYFGYGDWARGRAYAVGAKLGEEQLDRPFEIGMGSVRRTLAHLRDAEQWWLENWTLGPGRLFPEADPRISISELTRLFDETVRHRSEFFSRLTDSDLLRPTSATPRPGVTRTFPLGCTMLQLCCHGTHHRAQVLNMFRHLGAEVPALDYVAMLHGRG